MLGYFPYLFRILKPVNPVNNKAVPGVFTVDNNTAAAGVYHGSAA